MAQNDPYHTTAFRVSVPITTDSSGDFTKTTEKLTGRLVQLRYVPAASNALDANWDLDVVGETTETVLLDIDNLAATAIQRAIGQILYDETGTVTTWDGTNEFYVPGILVVNEGITVTVAQGGNVQSGTLHLIFTPA